MPIKQNREHDFIPVQLAFGSLNKCVVYILAMSLLDLGVERRGASLLAPCSNPLQVI